MNILFIAIGGAVGSIARYLLGVLVKNYINPTFPLATFLVNIIGCLLIGILYGIFDKYNIGNSLWNYFLIVGFCGAFTTFSTFASENFNLFQSGNSITAMFYIIMSVILGIIFVKIGYSFINR